MEIYLIIVKKTIITKKRTKLLVAQKIAKKLSISDKEASAIINEVFVAIQEVLKCEGKVTISKFGTFTYALTREVRNPLKQGGRYYKIHFKSYRKDKVNEKDEGPLDK